MKTTYPKPTKKIARKVKEIVDVGLTSGKGRPVPGELCVEAAVCLAMGLPHSDEPPCVGSQVRGFKIGLNDCDWTSKKARANGMRKLAVAQLGSESIDQTKFKDLLCIKGVNRILPLLCRTLSEDKECRHKDELLAAAKYCESAKTLEDSRMAAKEARSVFNLASAYASAYASASASAYTSAYTSASTSASAYAYAYAYASASASAYAYTSAYAYAYWKEKLGEDCLLKLSAEIALEVLIELKSPGCKWLDIFNE